MKKPLILFYPDLPLLSKNELQVLDLLIEAGKLIVPIYLEQENRGYLGANFYPKGVSRAEIENAAKKDPEILSPYTVVEKVNGKLVPIPYHVKYANLLKPVADKLLEAASITNNKEFGNFLRLRAESLLNGSYDKAFAAKIKLKPYILDISMGPMSQFDDHLFYAKASYQAWIGVLDKEGTDRLNNYKSITLSAVRKGITQKGRIDDHDKVKAIVLDVILFSGFMARAKFAGVHLPTDISFIEKYGAEIVLFNQPNDLKVKEQIIPTFNRIFPKEFRDEFEYEDIRRGYLRGVALHELAHSYLLYKDSAKNLQDLFPVIDELTATILGLRMAGSLLLKDRINNKQLESMIVTFLCRSFYQTEKIDTPTDPLRNYVIGGNIFINFMIKNGSIKESGKIIIPNFMKIFVSLNDLSDSLETLLATGTRKDAEEFIKKYGTNK